MSATKTKNNIRSAPRPAAKREPTAQEVLDRMRANNRARAQRRADKAARTLGKITMTPSQRAEVDLVVAHTGESISKALGRILVEEASRLTNPGYEPEGVLKRTKSLTSVYTANIGFLLLDTPQNAALNYIVQRTKESTSPLIRRLFSNEAKRALANGQVSHPHAA
jgi:hypothetical protein